MRNIILAIALLMSLSCGAKHDNDIMIMGTVSIDSSMPRNPMAPIIVIAANTSDIEVIENNPSNAILAMTTANPYTGIFTIHCKDADIYLGQEIFLFAFIDNDYTGGIPHPSPGDAIGFFSKDFKLSYIVGFDEQPNIHINRFHYNYNAKIIGLIEGYEAGNVILIAYAGDFNSSNFSDIDINAVIGYKKLIKPAQPVSFTLPVMPYGYNVPIGGVYVIALLDANANGIPDEGDTIGFAVEPGSNTPVAVTVTNGVVSASTIKFVMPIYGEPATNDPPLTITGQFDAPEGYSASATKPIFVVVARGSDPNEVFANIKNLNTQTFDFTRVTQGENTFALTLSRSKFNPGDQVFIFALWDKDYESGLPNATSGDILGFVMNKSNFAYTVTLQEGDNQLMKSGTQYLFNGNGGYSFSLNRTIYNHNATIRFQLEKGSLNDTQFANGTRVIVVAVYETNDIAQQYLQYGTYNLDMDKIIATANVRINKESGSNTTVYYTMPVMPAFLDTIPAMQDEQLFIDNVWVLAVLDSNGNGKPDSGEYIGYYWKPFELFGIPVPDTYIPSKLSSPLGDGTTILNKTVRFSSYTY